MSSAPKAQAAAPMRVVILGLSITSSWGNGHATTFRGLMRELSARGHDVLFLERDVPWYSSHRDLPKPPYGRTALYSTLAELKERFGRRIREADLVVVGSFVPEGVKVGTWVTSVARGVTAFYDIDTPVTLAKLETGDCEYLDPALIPSYQIYLSFTGGPTLELLQKRYRAQAARALYCSVDPLHYYPEPGAHAVWDLGYIGTYCADRQAVLERLMLSPARAHPELRCVVAGPLYPPEISWPGNVERIDHLPPSRHRSFYSSQRYTLNITRREMIDAGYSPSVRLFEAAACGTPIVSDSWNGLGTFFRIGEEILIARTPEESLRIVRDLPETERLELGHGARKRVLAEHTAAHRAIELERIVAPFLTRTGVSGSIRSAAR